MISPLGFFNRPWVRLPLSEELDAIAATGTSHLGLLGRPGGGAWVDWDTPAEDLDALAQEVSQRGLRLHAVRAGVHFDVPFGEAVSRYRAFIDRAAALGVRHLLEMGAHDPDKYPFYFDVMKAVAPYAQDKGLIIGVKPHGGLTTSGKDTADAVKRVDHPAYRLWYDPGNILFYKQLDPVAEVEHVKGLAAGVCVKDCLIDAEGRPSVQVTPGEGQVDFEGVFRALVDGGFAGGPCLVETLGPEDPHEAIQAGKRALDYIAGVMSAVGLTPSLD